MFVAVLPSTLASSGARLSYHMSFPGWLDCPSTTAGKIQSHKTPAFTSMAGRKWARVPRRTNYWQVPRGYWRDVTRLNFNNTSKKLFVQWSKHAFISKILIHIQWINSSNLGDLMVHDYADSLTLKWSPRKRCHDATKPGIFFKHNVEFLTLVIFEKVLWRHSHQPRVGLDGGTLHPQVSSSRTN